jgi:hypothetical protein
MNLWTKAKERQWELVAGVAITALVVGIPWLSNGGLAGSSGSGGSAASATTTLPGALAGSPALAGAPPNSTAPGQGGFDDDFLGILHRVSAPATTAPATTAPPTTVPPTTAPAPVHPGTTAPPSTSPPTTAPPAPSVPGRPSNLALDFGTPALAVHWDAVAANTDGTPFSGTYQIAFRTATTTRTYQTAASSFTYAFDHNGFDFGTPQSELTVTVVALGITGTAGAPVSGVAMHPAPATPDTPPTLAAGTGSITVTGTVPAGATDVAGFDISEYQAGSTDPFVFLGSTTGTGAFVHDVASGSTHTYAYRVRDGFGQVSPGFSPTATATAS